MISAAQEVEFVMVLCWCAEDFRDHNNNSQWDTTVFNMCHSCWSWKCYWSNKNQGRKSLKPHNIAHLKRFFLWVCCINIYIRFFCARVPKCLSLVTYTVSLLHGNVWFFFLFMPLCKSGLFWFFNRINIPNTNVYLASL